MIHVDVSDTWILSNLWAKSPFRAMLLTAEHNQFRIALRLSGGENKGWEQTNR